jgi:subtilisin family serine protease
MEAHPLGFVLAEIPPLKFLDVITNEIVRRIDTAENLAEPMNNNAYKAIGADLVWAKGYDGTGVKVAILDSGLDTDPTNSDLPSSFDKKDYSNPASPDDNVENLVTGHGTHVTGIVLGRGTLSASNTGNGSGAYKGMAPDASLVFLKIGRDSDGAATSAAMEAAMTAAVSTYNAKIITMSYGGWGTYNDGSESTEQKIDWCYDQGVPVFVSAGNEADDARHYSNIVDPNDSTGFIQVNVGSVTAGSTKLAFNLVWRDGAAASSALSIRYFNASLARLTDVTDNTTTESPRGTESHTSYYNPYLTGSGTFYVKVYNASSGTVFFHLYEYWGSKKVLFENPDPKFTISNPATADHAMSVAAWTTRTTWKSADGNTYVYPGETLNAISTFSSQGPRVDWVQKPDIAAPGCAIISIRDRDRYTSTNSNWVDNDGTTGGEANYYVMQGTSMACPMTAGAAALLLNEDPSLTPQGVYDALKVNTSVDANTGICPNGTWGYGKLNANAAVSSTVYVKLKVFLEGPYYTNGDTMRTALRQNSLIPVLSPYAEDARTIPTVPDSVTDWVLVQLRTTASGPAVASKSAFINRRGLIVGDDGTTNQIVLDTPYGNYYVAIKHRNHLAVMSANSVALNGGSSTLYDFTTGSEKFDQNGGAKQLETGVWGMFGGNANNSNNMINIQDYAAVKSKFAQSGYLKEDNNLSGVVNIPDYAITKSNFAKSSTVP